MSKEPLFVAVSNQKGGVGKSALTVVLSSYLHFEKNLNVAIIDCDYPIVGATAEKAREAADELAANGDYDLIFVDLPGTVESTGVFRTIVNMDYVLTPTTPDLIIMQSTLAFSTTVLDYVRNTKDVPLKDIIFFWNRLKKRTNVEVFKSYSEVMRELHLTVLDSTLPDLCRYEKEITHCKRAFFRCTLLPPPARQLEGSGIAELAEELIVKLKLVQS